MRTFLECIPCFLRQALEASRIASDDDRVRARILRRVLRDTAEFSFHLAPLMTQISHMN